MFGPHTADVVLIAGVGDAMPVWDRAVEQLLDVARRHMLLMIALEAPIAVIQRASPEPALAAAIHPLPEQLIAREGCGRSEAIGGVEHLGLNQRPERLQGVADAAADGQRAALLGFGSLGVADRLLPAEAKHRGDALALFVRQPRQCSGQQRQRSVACASLTERASISSSAPRNCRRRQGSDGRTTGETGGTARAVPAI